MRPKQTLAVKESSSTVSKIARKPVEATKIGGLLSPQEERDKRMIVKRAKFLTYFPYLSPRALKILNLTYLVNMSISLNF